MLLCLLSLLVLSIKIKDQSIFEKPIFKEKYKKYYSPKYSISIQGVSRLALLLFVTLLQYKRYTFIKLLTDSILSYYPVSIKLL